MGIILYILFSIYRILNKYNLNSLKPVYKSNYSTEILGDCEYIQYNLDRKEEVL